MADRLSYHRADICIDFRKAFEFAIAHCVNQARFDRRNRPAQSCATG